VNRIVASDARYLICLERIHNRGVGRIFIKGPHARVAVQTLHVAVSAFQMDCLGWCTHVLHIKVMQAFELVLQGPYMV